MTLSEEIKERNRLAIEAVVLTDEEQKASDFEGKKKKYFKDKHAEHWKQFENGFDSISTKEVL